jgi:hypothetical protein
MGPREVSRLQAIKSKFLQSIKKRTERDKIQNQDRQDLKIETLQENMVRLRTQCYKHVLHMDNSKESSENEDGV